MTGIEIKVSQGKVNKHKLEIHKEMDDKGIITSCKGTQV